MSLRSYGEVNAFKSQEIPNLRWIQFFNGNPFLTNVRIDLLYSGIQQRLILMDGNDSFIYPKFSKKFEVRGTERIGLSIMYKFNGREYKREMIISDLLSGNFYYIVVTNDANLVVIRADKTCDARGQAKVSIFNLNYDTAPLSVYIDGQLNGMSPFRGELRDSLPASHGGNSFELRDMSGELVLGPLKLNLLNRASYTIFITGVYKQSFSDNKLSLELIVKEETEGNCL